MRQVLVTGANKGIGYGIAKGILADHDDTFVFLGARDTKRGVAAVDELKAGDASFEGRVRFVQLDVARDDSVAAAVTTVRGHLGEGGRLYGLVNNAGVGLGGQTLSGVLEVNVFGMHRVSEAFLPLIDRERGRVVNITSAAGPSFVAKCSKARQSFFLDANSEWSELEALMKECIALAGDEAAFRERGLSDGDPYGLSKACANTYTLQLARRHPELKINAVTPGFIETDLTRGYAVSQGKKPAELGMKTPDQGARAPLKLLFGELEGNGRYYGSDGLRSPLDRYRSPGDPEYKGD